MIPFLEKHLGQILFQAVTIVGALVTFTWVAGAQVEKTSQSLQMLTNRIGKVETTLEEMHTLDLRVTRLEQGLIKTGDIVSRLERAVVRLEALAEK